MQIRDLMYLVTVLLSQVFLANSFSLLLMEALAEGCLQAVAAEVKNCHAKAAI